VSPASRSHRHPLFIDPTLEVTGGESDLATTEANEGNPAFVNEAPDVTFGAAQVGGGLDDVEQQGARIFGISDI